MAMPMSEMYNYGASREPSWLVNHAQHGLPSYDSSRPTAQAMQQNMARQYRYSSYTHHGVPLLEFFVPMCCAKCEEKVREELLELRGVENVMIDQQLQKVIATGYMDPLRALKKLKKVKKKAAMWSSAAIAAASSSSSAGHSSPAVKPGGYEYHTPAVRPAGYSPYAGGEYVQSKSLQQPYPLSSYSTSYNSYTPSFGAGQSSYYYPPAAAAAAAASRPSSAGYSQIVTNPHHMKRIESD